MLLSSFGVTWPSWWWDSTNSKLTATLLVTLIVVLWLLWRFKSSINTSTLPSPLPPGPVGFPLVGYLPFLILGTHLHLKFDKLARVYGPIFKLMLGTKTFVVVSSPSLVKEIVRDQDTIFANRDPPIALLLSLYGGDDIASLPYGPQWKKARKILVRELLSNTNLSNSFSHRRVEIQKSIKHVYEEKIGCPVNVGELAFLTATNSIMSMIWGETLQGEEGAAIGVEFRALVSELMVLIGKPNISDVYPALAWLDLQGIESKTRKVSQWIDRLFDSVIEKRMNVTENRETKSEKKDFLQYLLQVEFESSGSHSASMTMNEIKALLIDIVIGGTDTSSTTLEWVVARLLQNPEAMKRVHEELDAVIGLDNCVELESQLSKLHYLEAVIKETLRLHPPIPFIPRCPSQTSTVGGYTIPKGAQVFLNVWTIHRDPEIWEDALEFRPERFLSGDSGKWGNKFEYLPFGSGRRICAGLPLAEKMVIFMLASFLHSFEWRLPSGTVLELSGEVGIVIKKMKPLIAIPKPRLSKPELYQ